MRVNDNPKKEE